MSQLYTIVFSGKVAEGCSEDEVKAKLAESFGMPLDKVGRIFSGQPVVIKRGLNREEAEKYQQMFSDAGAISAIRPEAPDEPAPEPSVPAPPATPVESPSPVRPQSVTIPSGFWRRVAAFLVDVLVLAIPGGIIGWAFYDQLVRIGQAGRLIGFAIALCYFALLNSSIGNGQTLGKRLLKIRVVDLQGDTIPLHRSALRYLLLGVPYFCNGLQLNQNNLWLGIPLAAIVFGLGGSILYFFLFNRNNRRTVHDFAAGTVVVRAEPQAVPQLLPLWRGHFVILAILMVGLGGAATLMVPSLLHKEPFARMLAIQAVLQKEPGIHNVGVQEGVTRSGDNTTHWFAVNVAVADPQLDFEKTADRFARLVLTQDANIEKEDLLLVTVGRGFDIGIAYGWVNQRFSHSPEQWRAKLGVGRL
jgi:uncharacterized RDD family membrane protein YckC